MALTPAQKQIIQKAQAKAAAAAKANAAAAAKAKAIHPSSRGKKPVKKPAAKKKVPMFALGDTVEIVRGAHRGKYAKVIRVNTEFRVWSYTTYGYVKKTQYTLELPSELKVKLLETSIRLPSKMYTDEDFESAGKAIAEIYEKIRANA